MSGFSRRDFLSLSGSAAVAAMAGPANAAMGPNDKFDLVIKGGDVLDPSQSLRGKRDIGIRWGMIEAVENDIPAARAAKTIDASGKLVTPGLIDLHSHVYPYGSAIGIPADELVQAQATTTVVSAGDAGVNNLAALRRYIVAQSRARIYAFVHIANNGLSGFPVAELYNIDYAQVEACAMALAENPDFLLGVKVRMSENVIAKHGVEPLKRGIKACEMCGWPAKMMVHIGGVETKELMSLSAGDAGVNNLAALSPGSLSKCFQVPSGHWYCVPVQRPLFELCRQSTTATINRLDRRKKELRHAQSSPCHSR